MTKLDNPCKFKINERVTSKKTGLPITGSISGVMTPVSYAFSLGLYTREMASKGLKRWTEVDKNWLDKMVYCVIFDTPTRTISFEEYHKVTERTKEEYEKEVEPKYVAMYPEEDLELL